MREFIVSILALFLTANVTAAELPNILWITCEDINPNLGCYGDHYAVTPNLDALAAKGMRYTNAISNAPVCAPREPRSSQAFIRHRQAQSTCDRS